MTTTEQGNSPDHQQALDELKEAAQLAQETLALDPSLSSQAHTDGAQTVDASQDGASLQDDRQARQMDRAKRQRDRGRKEMEREYKSVMVVDRELEVFDPAIASSVTRFMALTDRTIFLLTRYGERFLSTDQVELILGAMQSKIDTYINDGVKARQAAQELIKQYSPAEYIWLKPRYTSSTLKYTFKLKTRGAVLLADGSHEWDEAIRMMCELQFNGKAKSDQIAAVRRNERTIFKSLNYFCVQTIMGMYQNSMPAELQVTKPIEEVAPMHSAE